MVTEAIADPEESVSLHVNHPCTPEYNQPIHSKDQRNDQKAKNVHNKDEPSPMDFDDSNKADDEKNKPDDKTEGKHRRKK